MQIIDNAERELWKAKGGAIHLEVNGIKFAVSLEKVLNNFGGINSGSMMFRTYFYYNEKRISRNKLMILLK